MRNKLIAFICLGSLFISGCANREVNLSAPNSPLQKAEIMPTKEQLSGQKTKVVIFETEQHQIPLAEQASLGHTVSSELAKYIAQTGSEIIDRNLASQLEEELKLAEIHGKSSFDGPKVTDFAINGKITNAKVSSSFSEAYTWQDKDGKYHTTPARCTHKASVSGSMKIYKMIPKLSYVTTVEISDTVSHSQETRNSRCPIPKDQQQSLLRSAAQSAVKDSRIAFQNHFAPKAYILQAKQNEDRMIFKLSGGKNDGFQEKADLMIYTNEVSKNPITGEESVEEMELVEGIMSDKIGTNYAWIIVEDKMLAQRVRLGDYVKVKYSKGFFEF